MISKRFGMHQSFCRRCAPPVVAMLLGVATLTGCGDKVLETGLGYDYLFGDAPALEPTPLQRIPEESGDFPNLGAVPHRPHDPLSADVYDTYRQRLQRDNRGGHLAGDVLDEEAPLPPAPAAEDIPEPPGGAAEGV